MSEILFKQTYKRFTITVKSELDEYARNYTDYLGEFSSKQPDGWHVDRYRGWLLGDLIPEPDWPGDEQDEEDGRIYRAIMRKVTSYRVDKVAGFRRKQESKRSQYLEALFIKKIDALALAQFAKVGYREILARDLGNYYDSEAKRTREVTNNICDKFSQDLYNKLDRQVTDWCDKYLPTWRYQVLMDEWNDCNQEIVEDVGRTCYDQYREARYWVPTNQYEDCTREERTKYLLQEHKRLEDLSKGYWCYIGIIVTITDKNGCELGEASVWGVESDGSKEYLREEAWSVFLDAWDEAEKNFNGWDKRAAKSLDLDLIKADLFAEI